jgi:hypothetical protein
MDGGFVVGGESEGAVGGIDLDEQMRLQLEHALQNREDSEAGIVEDGRAEGAAGKADESERLQLTVGQAAGSAVLLRECRRRRAHHHIRAIRLRQALMDTPLHVQHHVHRDGDGRR